MLDVPSEQSGEADRKHPDQDLGDGVAVVGAGIGGLVTALSLHQIGFEPTVFESVTEIRPAGVGINLLPHSIRELDALKLLDELAAHAIEPSTLAYFAKNGMEIWSEPRGRAAGYAWPQLSIHRAELHRILLEAVRTRIGEANIRLGHRLTRVDSIEGAANATFDGPSGSSVRVRAAAIVAADGIHSVARAHFYPHQGPPKWSGALSPDEISDITEGYRRTAGFALAALDDPTSLIDRDYRATTES